ncbi:oligosaccharide biosynthesis protein Alg14 [Halomonas sp. QHL1]|nr:oligosaccharide biosynthesis protein Alg14 [Halomonas sp. QHL1]
MVASFGGHWVQLQRLSALLDAEDRVYVSTADRQNAGATYYLDDFSVHELWRGVIQLPKAFKMVRECHPDLIISTGAAPGLLVLFAGFLLRRKTLWVDSIANCRRLSLSGRVARLFASEVLTQWPELARGRVRYLGRLL